VPLLDVLLDAVGHEVPDRVPLGHPPPDVGRAVGERRHLDEAHTTVGQAGVGQVMAGSRDADEVGQVEQLVGAVPPEDLRQRVGARDEEQLS
jgi:hypothetical protein